MYTGRCLCGLIVWEILEEPYSVYNCHCRMCQKTHGAAFGTYCFLNPGQIRWISDTYSIVKYTSSDVLVRSSCKVCGSVVPYLNENDNHWIAPGGCHDEMRKPDCNIFVSDNSPWHTISGNLPQYTAYPEETGLPSVEGIPIQKLKGNSLSGSCLCGSITFKVTEPFITAHNCHCSRCRYGRAAAHATNGFVNFDGIQFTGGKHLVGSYKVSNARYFTQVFCTICSSIMPRKDKERGIAVIPLASLDDDPKIKPVDHIHVGSKPQWHDITDDLPQFLEGPIQ